VLLERVYVEDANVQPNGANIPGQHLVVRDTGATPTVELHLFVEAAHRTSQVRLAGPALRQGAGGWGSAHSDGAVRRTRPINSPAAGP
jgi:hypothetical protein